MVCKKAVSANYRSHPLTLPHATIALVASSVLRYSLRNIYNKLAKKPFMSSNFG